MSLSSRVLAITALSMLAAFAGGQDTADFEVHEISLWVADRGKPLVNDHDMAPSGLPSMVESKRSRTAPPDKPALTPLGLIVLTGSPQPSVDIDVRLTDGRVLAHWPKAEVRNNRVRWLSTALLTDCEDPERLVYVTPGHWFERARTAPHLFVRNGSRVERFLAYDPELKFAAPLRLEIEGDDFRVVNESPDALEDVLVIDPGPKGLRLGWIDRLPAGPQSPASGTTEADAKPTETASATVSLSAATSSGGTASDGSALLAQALGERLKKSGLPGSAVDLFTSIHAPAIAATSELIVVARLPQSLLDAQLPLEAFPAPRRIVRSAWLVVGNVDPRIGQEIDALIAQLGSPKYQERESAEKRLAELGALATPALKAALKNSDLEIVHRVDRILAMLDPMLNPNNNGGANLFIGR